jgi:membrane protein implicated in regulation of membrane protease activity
MIGAMQADVKTFQEIEADPSAISQAVTVIIIAGVAALIGNIFRVGIVGGVLQMCIQLIGYAIFSVLVVLIGTKLMPEPSTKADFQEGFRVIGFAA